MTYLRPNNRSRSRPIVIAVSVIIVLIIVIQIFLPHLFPALVTTIAVPFWRAEFAVESGSLNSPQKLLEQNEELRRQLLDQEVQIQSVRLLQEENSSLKEILGRASTTPHTLAAILKRPPLVPYDEFIIDAGADLNLEVGQKVYAPGEVLIGRVIDVLGHTAKIRLLSSPGERYEIVVGEARTPTTAYGRGGGQYRAELPSDIVVKDGDVVLSPALGEGIFGFVTAVVNDPTQPFETILFAPPVNVFELRWVLIDTRKVE